MPKQYGIVKVDYITYTTGDGGSEADQTLDVSGLAGISASGITVTGTISGVSGIFSENITVNGTGIFNDLYVSGETILSGDVTASGDVGVSGELTVSSITSTGAINANGNLNVSGLTTVSGLLVTGDSTTAGAGGYLSYNLRQGSSTERVLSISGKQDSSSPAAVVLNPSGGLVGVGTDNPTKTFEVRGPAGANDLEVLLAPGSSSNRGVNLNIKNYTTTNSPASVISSTWNNGGTDREVSRIEFINNLADANKRSGSIAFSSYGTDGSINSSVLHVDHTAQVGINQTDPAATLDMVTAAGTDCKIKLNEGTTTNAFEISQTSTESLIQSKASQPLTIGSQDTTGSSAYIQFKTRDIQRLKIDQNGRVVVNSNSTYSVNGVNRYLQVHDDNGSEGLTALNWASGTGGATIALGKSKSGTIGTHALVDQGNTLGGVTFHGSDGSSSFNTYGRISCLVADTPSATSAPGALDFATTAPGDTSPVRRLRIDDLGRLIIGPGTGISSAQAQLAGTSLITNTTQVGFSLREWRPSTSATDNVYGINTGLRTSASSNAVHHYRAEQGSFTGTVTNQYGFIAASGLTSATNNYGFYSNISSASGRWNFYANGTANNYFASNVGIGTNDPQAPLHIKGSGSAQTNVTLENSTTSTQKLIAGLTGTNNLGFSIYDDLLSQTTFRIDNNGNVGIGTDSPDAKLSVTTSQNWNFPQVFLRRDASNNAGNNIKMIAFGLEADSYSQTPASSASFIGLNADTAPTTGDTVLSQNAKLNLTSPGGVIMPVGNVGIGTSSPESNLHVSASGGAVLRLQDSSGNDGVNSALISKVGTTQLKLQASAGTGNRTIVFNTSSTTEAMRIDDNGTLLVGTSAASNVAGNFGINSGANIQVVASSTFAAYSAISKKNDASGPLLALASSRSDAIVQAGDRLGEIRFAGYDGTDYQTNGALIKAEVDGTPGTNDMPGRLVFSTTADGDSNPTERMRLDSQGRFTMGEYASRSSTLNIRPSSDYTGAATTWNVLELQGTAPSQATDRLNGCTVAVLPASGVTVNTYNYFRAFQNPLTGGTAINTQVGFMVENNLTGATNNHGFYSNISSASGRWNFYANGTASNYFAGNTLFNTANGAGIDGGSASGFSIGSDAVIRCSRTGTAGHQFLQFRRNNSSTPVGSIECDGTSTSYNTSSDYRLKENITPMVGAADRVKALKPCRFNFIAEPDKTVDGFLAHEAQEVVPESITGTKDATEAIGTLFDWDGTVREKNVTEPTVLTYSEEVVITPAVEAADATYDEEGEELTPAVKAVEEVRETVTREMTWEKTGDRDVMQGIDQSKLVPLLTAALQEALSEITELKERVKNLEG